MTTYYCFITNTELIKLKVEPVDIGTNSIFISNEISKNKKDEYVSIPDELLKLLISHVSGADKNDYLFSCSDCKPVNKPLPVKRLITYWEKVREIVKLFSGVQFYSLKNIEITDLFNAGIPVIKVRDQARHYDIKITELYIPRGKDGVVEIKNANIAFL